MAIFVWRRSAVWIPGCRGPRQAQTGMPHGKRCATASVELQPTVVTLLVAEPDAHENALRNTLSFFLGKPKPKAIAAAIGSAQAWSGAWRKKRRDDGCKFSWRLERRLREPECVCQAKRWPRCMQEQHAGEAGCSTPPLFAIRPAIQLAERQGASRAGQRPSRVKP